MGWTANDTDMDQFWSWRLRSYAAIVADVHLLDLQDLDSSIGLLPQPDGDILRDEHPAHAHHALLPLDQMALQFLKPRDRSSSRSPQRTEVALYLGVPPNSRLFCPGRETKHRRDVFRWFLNPGCNSHVYCCSCSFATRLLLPSPSTAFVQGGAPAPTCVLRMLATHEPLAGSPVSIPHC
ncbi:hypothetical protein B296_00044357 [Ensete ventricosum]|uniref:Uncharacterized protein n=1 Tax=Ensete ventricosum TaxID=4639 RepID=A0A426YJ29_ENSVE|nr:hypothetical protein B296_00044357 [Ensete ventricosum]